jgi:hypothetical protein
MIYVAMRLRQEELLVLQTTFEEGRTLLVEKRFDAVHDDGAGELGNATNAKPKNVT